MSTFDEHSLLAVGTVIRATYVVEDLVGVGAFGAVYRVRHRFLGTQAMKVFHQGQGAPTAEELIEEARILSTLVHPNIVRLFEANTLDVMPGERPYLTMEYTSSGNLEAVLERRVRLHPLSALKTTRQVCSGLAVAHHIQPPIVHRDITARNLLVYGFSAHGTPQVKVGDFGLAKHVDPDSLMTRPAGTVAYMAPEAAWGYHTPASDIYSVGVVLYRMLTGLFPFPLPDASDLSTAPSARDAVARSRRVSPRPPSALKLGLSTQIDDLIQTALAPGPSDRFPNADAFGAELDRLIHDFNW